MCCLGNKDISFKKRKEFDEEEGRGVRKIYCWRDQLLFNKAMQVSEGEI